MSHFTVLVIGDNIDEQMAPYAEQEVEEQYLKFNDTEDESLNEYKTKDVDIVVLSDGTLHTKYAEQFRNPDLSNFSNQYIYPPDSIIKKGKYSELYSSFESFMEGWHGSEERDEKTGRYGYWHNPQAKWDWYSEGGRWTGFFKPKLGATGSVGTPGLMTKRPTNGWVDSIRLCNIDIEGMQQEAIREANETYDKLESILNGRALPSWNEIREKHGENIDAARNEYNDLQVVKDLNKADFFIMGDFVETFGKSREQYIQKMKNHTMVPYAFVKDSKWYQKGEMGWFGMSSDEITQDEWNRQFWEMINSLPQETQLTLLDCHI